MSRMSLMTFIKKIMRLSEMKLTPPPDIFYLNLSFVSSSQLRMYGVYLCMQVHYYQQENFDLAVNNWVFEARHVHI